MKNSFWKDFALRGLAAAAGGPVVLAIIYGILGATGAVETLTPKEVCLGVLTVTVMAFVAAGITAIYQTERLPLIGRILIHAAVLYADYLFMYLLNSWMPRNWSAIGIFSGFFVGGFALVWLGIYLSIRKNTSNVNRHLPKA